MSIPPPSPLNCSSVFVHQAHTVGSQVLSGLRGQLWPISREGVLTVMFQLLCFVATMIYDEEAHCLF